MLKYNGNLGKDAPQTFHHLSSTLLLGHIYLVCKGDGKNLQYIKCDVKSTISFKVLSPFKLVMHFTLFCKDDVSVFNFLCKYTLTFA